MLHKEVLVLVALVLSATLYTMENTYTSLHSAIAQNDITETAQLLKEGADPLQKNDQNQTAWEAALAIDATSGDILRLLIQFGGTYGLDIRLKQNIIVERCNLNPLESSVLFGRDSNVAANLRDPVQYQAETDKSKRKMIKRVPYTIEELSRALLLAAGTGNYVNLAAIIRYCQNNQIDLKTSLAEALSQITIIRNKRSTSTWTNLSYGVVERYLSETQKGKAIDDLILNTETLNSAVDCCAKATLAVSCIILTLLAATAVYAASLS